MTDMEKLQIAFYNYFVRFRQDDIDSKKTALTESIVTLQEQKVLFEAMGESIDEATYETQMGNLQRAEEALNKELLQLDTTQSNLDEFSKAVGAVELTLEDL